MQHFILNGKDGVYGCMSTHLGNGVAPVGRTPMDLQEIYLDDELSGAARYLSVLRKH